MHNKRKLAVSTGPDGIRQPARWRVALAIGTTFLAGLVACQSADTPEDTTHPAEQTRIPIDYPMVESDRPDLLSEPRADEDWRGSGDQDVQPPDQGIQPGE